MDSCRALTSLQCIASDTTYNYVLQVRTLAQSLWTANTVRINSGTDFSPASMVRARGTLASLKWTSRRSSGATYGPHLGTREPPSECDILFCSCTYRSQPLLT